MSNSQTENGEHGFQILALFNGFPEIDVTQLTQSIDGLVTSSAQCLAGDFSIGQIREDKRVVIGTVFLDGLKVGLILHEWALPETSARYSIGMSNWSGETKAMLAGHTCYALVSCIGQGEPIDKVLALYKVGLALIEQGAIGIASEMTWSAYPAEVFEGLKLPGMWESVRGEGSPAEFLVGFGRFMVDGERWLMSKGHFLFGLPELAFKVTDNEQVEEMYGIFKSIFSYLYQNGPVIEAGHTLEIEEGAFMSFAAPTTEQEFIASPTGTLIIELDRV